MHFIKKCLLIIVPCISLLICNITFGDGDPKLTRSQSMKQDLSKEFESFLDKKSVEYPSVDYSIKVKKSDAFYFVKVTGKNSILTKKIPEKRVKAALEGSKEAQQQLLTDIFKPGKK